MDSVISDIECCMDWMKDRMDRMDGPAKIRPELNNKDVVTLKEDDRNMCPWRHRIMGNPTMYS